MPFLRVKGVLRLPILLYSEKKLGFSRKGVEVNGDFVELQSIIIGLGPTLGR
jgi:hypothetical protein